MAKYKYSAISKSGEKINGIVDGFNELDAVDKIKQNCDIVLKISEAAEKKEGFLNQEIGGNRLNFKAFTVMCSQFAIIIRAGIPVARATRLIAAKTADKPLKKILEQVAEDIDAGRSLAASFEERGDKLLPATFIETIRAGEESGNIDRAFDTLYTTYDKQLKIRGKVKSAMTYPAFILVLSIVVVIVLMVKVVPTFMDIFASYDAELPAITKSLIVVSNFFSKCWWVLLLITAAAVLAFKLYTATEEGHIKVSRLSLRVPVLGEIGQLNAASQFAGNMATLLGSGLSATKAINITAKVLDNYYIGTEIGKISARIEQGYAIGKSLEETHCLPDILTDMVAVGEESGELEQTLRTISGYYDAELSMATDTALKKLEPAILVFIAAIAGYIVLAVYIAMFQMYAVM